MQNDKAREYCSEEVFMKQVVKHSIAQLIVVLILFGYMIL
jgi:hypothetical protein